MKWEGRRKSSNVEDRRGISTGGKTLLGGGLIGVIILLVNLFGSEELKKMTPVLEQFNSTKESTTEITKPLTSKEKELGDFVSTVFADTEDVWSKIFKENQRTYVYPKLVLFSNSVETACGGASSASGPFYCPSDQKVYMDLDFFDELKTKFGAVGGDFAMAYVIAHEVGHHVQTLLGTSAQVRKEQKGLREAEQNKLSVSLELQADFYAGVWTHYNKKYLDSDDIEEALSAAQAVGDDAIQRRIQGHVVPESFTHGTSEERKFWFMKGYETGDISQGNTFQR